MRAHALVKNDKRPDWADRSIPSWMRALGMCRCGRRYDGHSKQDIREQHRAHLEYLRTGRE